MESQQYPIRAAQIVIRSLRFFYLLWGGMLLISNAWAPVLRSPDFLWEYPKLLGFLSGNQGRAILFGLGLTMALAALFEVWELIDGILVRFLHEQEKEP